MWNNNESNVPTVFYHESIANICKAVEHVFTGITLGRQSAHKYREYEVPVVFTQKDVMISKLQQESKERDIRNVLPRLGLSVVNIKTTNLSGSQQVDQFLRYKKQDGSTIKVMYTGVPVKISFELICIANKFHELLNIYEYITPRFRKTIPVAVTDTVFKIKRDIHLSLTDESWDLTRQIEFGKNRAMSFSLDLEMTGYLYPPVEDKGTGIIKHIILDYLNANIDGELSDTILDPDDYISFVIDRWDVDPSSAGKEEPHDQVLSRIDTVEGTQIIAKTEHNK